MCCVFMGCGADAQPESEMEVSTESDKSSVWDALHVASQKYFVQENYEISGDALFLPISVEAVSNGDYDETVFTEYVCVSDKTVWLQSYKSYYGGRRGFAVVVESIRELSDNIKQLIEQNNKD